MTSPVLTKKDLVKHVLENAERFEWTLQGLGMLRTYLSSNRALRLHVWHPVARVKNVSDIHTHPWSFTSEVIAGAVTNVRYARVLEYESQETLDMPLVESRILCGEGGGLIGFPQNVWLRRGEQELYFEGESYAQSAEEIHRSIPSDGTVTIIRRTFGTDVDHASVFWERSKEWGSAEPRPPTREELRGITGAALERWF